MNDRSATEVLNEALFSACLRDLPGIGRVRVDADEAHEYQAFLSTEDVRIYRETLNAIQSDDDLLAFYNMHGIRAEMVVDRPFPSECEVTMFRQCWSSTAIGYDAPGGVAGRAFRRAYTVVVECARTGFAAVYFDGGRLAYLVPPENQDDSWDAALRTRQMPSQAGARRLGWIPGPVA